MRLLLLLPVILLCLFRPAFAYEVSELKAAGLYEEFDPDRLTTLEKKFLQTGLAMEGLYKSPIDGLWGRGSQQALKLYAVRHGHNDTIPIFEVFALAMKTGNRFAEQRLEVFYLSFMKMSLLIPFIGIERDEREDDFFSLKSKKSSIRYFFYRTNSGFVSQFHQQALADKNITTKPRVIRRNNLRISSFKLANGRNVYIRSDYVAGQWSSIVLTAQERDKGLLTAVAWSITKGKAPNIYLPEGYVRDGVEKTATFVLDKKKNAKNPARHPQMRTPSVEDESNPAPKKNRVARRDEGAREPDADFVMPSPEDLRKPFYPLRFSKADRKYLQLGLTLLGYFSGTIDGTWDRDSEAALARYAKKNPKYPPRIPLFQAYTLGLATLVKMDESQLVYYPVPHMGMSILMPYGTIGKEQDRTIAFRDKNSSLSYQLFKKITDSPNITHQEFLAGAVSKEKPQTIRKGKLWVTTIKATTGWITYLRSDYVQGSWATISVTADEKDAALFAAVTGSITPGEPAPDPYPYGGDLDDGIIAMRIIMGEGDARRRTPDTPSSPSNPFADEGSDSLPPKNSPAPGKRTDPEASSSGTGFAVSANGDLLTNNHVGGDCSRLTVDGHDAALTATDETFDLALLNVPALRDEEFATFAANPAPLNSDVTVAGYPLSGLLGGLNVTRGSVTSMKGLHGDSTRMQISAPVQPGNSGGPAMNAQGQVVGVVVAKLDAQRVADAIGDIPQNVNFAVRGSMAKLFLAQNGISPKTAPRGERFPPEVIATRLSAITHFIECY
ncbi:trypsin-like peptidase domain-containing protein [uncultured Roseibium sp.]|uniref:trypsin-like peptidase domain-containing protein n=1 Tax=uncultured Roseibium sp. TaxID=1936171 RepID=UPI003216458E